jgi:hypothetical protein
MVNDGVLVDKEDTTLLATCIVIVVLLLLGPATAVIGESAALVVVFIQTHATTRDCSWAAVWFSAPVAGQDTGDEMSDVLLAGFASSGDGSNGPSNTAP